jgi:uridine kinase
MTTKKIDEEVKVVRRIVRALAPFGSTTQQRIMQYINARFNIK